MQQKAPRNVSWRYELNSYAERSDSQSRRAFHLFSVIFCFQFVLGPGTDSTNCAGIRSYIIRCSLCARNSRTLGSQLHSDFSFRDCQEKDNRIMVAEQC